MDVEIVSASEAGSHVWKCDGALFVMPFTDPPQARRAATLMAQRARAKGLMLAVHDDARVGFIRIANCVFSCSESPYFGYVAQDAYPGRDWLAHALEPFNDRSMNLLAFNDGKWFGALAAYGLARRSWAQKTYGGSLFFPQYLRHYADTELTLVALEQKTLAYSPDSVLVEIDWEKDSRQIDHGDRDLFRERAQGGFDGRVASKELRSRFS